jgi:DNA polymerase-3 subunit delta
MTPRTTPRYYILHGEDELACKETLDELERRLGPPELSVLNTTVFEGNNVNLADLKNACDTIPFMSKRRMVLVHGLLSQLAPSHRQSDQGEKRFLDGLAQYLPQLPDSTRLIFVESALLSDNHPILRQAQQDPHGYVRAFERPKDMVQWVRRRAIERGGELSSEAAVALVQAVSGEQRLLDQEIEKLLAYTNRERPVDKYDVSLLVPYAQEAVIFDAVDALGHRDGVKAAQLIHNLLEHGNDPLYLFAMVVRQFRLLIQIKELADAGRDPSTISKIIKLHPYPTRKLYAQARNFALDQLEYVHRHLLGFDVQIKTGQIDSIVALDLLIATLAPPT